MSFADVATDIAVMVGLLVAVLYGLYRLVLWARTRARGAYVLGAALSPFMAAGNVSDPDFRIVNEAKQLKKREEDNPGDPPSDDVA
jgi:hypothetical protein